jgi:hypothetical protein
LSMKALLLNTALDPIPITPVSFRCRFPVHGHPSPAWPSFWSLSHVCTSMKTIIIYILSSLSVFAADTNDIRVVTWSYKILPEDSLATVEVFTRSGQTNLVRHTHTKGGVVLFRSQSFYHNGAEVGGYTYQTAGRPDATLIGSVPGAPYYFDVAFDSSNRPLSAHITATNFVLLDRFDCTNGVFYPTDSSSIRESNARLSKVIHPH